MSNDVSGGSTSSNSADSSSVTPKTTEVQVVTHAESHPNQIRVRVEFVGGGEGIEHLIGSLVSFLVFLVGT